MSVNLRIENSSAIGFDFIDPSAFGFSIIGGLQDEFSYDPNLGMSFFDSAFNTDWTASGALVTADDTSADELGPKLVSKFIAEAHFFNGDVSMTLTGRDKTADGASTFLSLDYMKENTWDDLFDEGSDKLVLSKSDDMINAGKGNDLVNGRSGDDFLFGGAGKDTLKGGGGSDSLDGGDGKDIIKGGGGDDTATGGGGRDKIKGGGGNDAIYGGSGNDKVEGNGDDDILSGGDGNDVLTGGRGGDTFQFQVFSDTRSNRDTFVDFKAGVDDIVMFFSRDDNVDLQAVLDAAKTGNRGLELDFGDGNLLKIRDVFDASTLVDDITTVSIA